MKGEVTMEWIDSKPGWVQFCALVVVMVVIPVAIGVGIAYVASGLVR